jgi:chorismate-pyruvate lyase
MSYSCPSIVPPVMREALTQRPSGASFQLIPRADLHLLYPLNEFYEESSLPLPFAAEVKGHEIPQPYRSLLVGDHDMTPALEGAYQRSIGLEVLRFALRDDVLSRQVVLVPDGHTRPAAFGAVKICLVHFPPEAKRLILELKQPLGTILRTQGIVHFSRPEAYLEVTPDAVIGRALGLANSSRLYGRRNVLWNQARQILAQIVEILPPSNGISGLEEQRATH